MPVLGLQRRLARAKLIQAVVDTANEKEEAAAAVSKQLSGSAVRLAQALAVVDATAALMVHVSSDDDDEKRKDL